VGVWTSRQGSTVHRIELKDDGTYVLHPNRARVSRSQTGRWNVAKDEMIWRYDASPGTRDVNPIERVNEKRFNLTETDGRTTHFELVRKVTGKRCGS
jgi:hypothetical protein